MDLDPFNIFGGNLLFAVLVLILKDLANHVMRGETQLVLRKLAVDPNPVRTETPVVEIAGRRAGLIGYFLTLLDLSPTVRLTANAGEVRKSIIGLQRHSLEVVPLSEQVSVRAEASRSLIWLAAALLSLIAGVPSGLLGGDGFLGKVMNALAWLAASGVYLFAYYQSHVFQITVHGSIPVGVSFKPSFIEGQLVQFQEVVAAAEVLMERIGQSRSFGRPAASPALGSVGVPAASFPPAYVPPFASDDASEFLDEDETMHEPAGAPPEPHSTGTVEYGEESHSFDEPREGWESGPEPGTADSIYLRQSITRSESGMFLGMAHVLSNAEPKSPPPGNGDTNHDATYRGTVAWEEHADTTQDEIRAEAELAELKRSRPRRGEAKLRLKELMRRFPQTQAAKKAHRMLDRLESSQQ